MVANPGGTAHASAVLKSQLVAVAKDTAFPRTFKEYYRRMKISLIKGVNASRMSYQFCRVRPRYRTHGNSETGVELSEIAVWKADDLCTCRRKDTSKQ